MSFENRSQLITAIQGWLNRAGDSDIINRADDFITLAEAAFRRDVRHYEMENIATNTLDGRYLARPADWLETINITVSSGNTRSLDLVSKKHMSDLREATLNATGAPRYYTHTERGFEFFPTPDGEYTLRLHYYQEIPSLDTEQNWLIRDYPDVYLYGALVHASPYLVEDDRATTWASLYGAALKRLNDSSNASIWSGAAPKMRVRGLG